MTINYVFQNNWHAICTPTKNYPIKKKKIYNTSLT